MAAVALWLGALSGPHVSVAVGLGVVAAGVCLAVVARNPTFLLVGLIGIGAVSGALASSRHQETFDATLPRGRGAVTGAAITDAIPYGTDFRFILRPSGWTPAGSDRQVLWPGPAIAVTSSHDEIAAGNRISVSGLLRADPHLIRGDPVAGRISATSILVLGGPASPVVGAGNAVRDRVASRLAILGASAEASLLSGFLIGDIADLPRPDNESLRRAGLTHYVAVSGSNVALVLGAWWLVLGPTGAGTRLRAVTGLIVLLVFVVATRWESSVIRAATMAALVLGGRAVGVAIDAWAALGCAVSVLLVMSGDLAYDVGFQLSVVATGGVLFGMNVWRARAPRIFWSLLAATVSAQLAVVPLLLIHFGSIPLLSPVANLLAAPLVTGATATAGAGVIVGWDLPLHIAQSLAGLVLNVARTAAGWPQLNAPQTAGLGAAVTLAWPTRMRWVVIGGIVAMSALSMVPPGPPDAPTIVFLDVGQGDAVLLRDPSGAVVLVDGGRDPTTLSSSLREHGVGRIDLVVATHGDADHVGGFSGLLETVAVGRIWVPDYANLGDLLGAVVDAAEHRGIPVDAVAVGESAVLGEFALDVLGPHRRYAADNDGSVVLLASVAGRSVLLPGDIGALAQAELDPVRPDLMMVPHHGAATSNLEWLADTVGDLAIISVGPNTYGHPAPEVLDTLIGAGTRVLTTRDEGDIAIALR